MERLIIFGIAGFLAQLVDGSLGMGYGLTSASILLAMGVTPAIASASIHFAEIATTAASGTAHLRFGNVDKSLLKVMILPGALGAFVGACFLSNISADFITPYISFGLLLLGVFILWRFLPRKITQTVAKPISRWKVVPVSILAGFCDSVGGGGWGPISTPVLLAHKGTQARKVVGTVDTSEFFVTAAGALGFVIALGLDDINWQWVAIFAISGLIAAPIAAALVRYLPARILGVLVGGAIVVTNVRTLLKSVGVVGDAALAVQILLSIALVALLVFSIKRTVSDNKLTTNVA